MSSVSDVSSRTVELGLASHARPGEKESGDGHLVKSVAGDGMLVAVADGLGHGTEAASATRVALDALDRHAGKAVLTLIQQCHTALMGTRGVVLTLAYLDWTDGTMTWIGVGNVEAALIYGATADSAPAPRANLVTRGGIVGSELPSLRAEVLSFDRGDTLILATDGIRSGFADGLPPGLSCQAIADHIMATHDKGTDDALVLVLRSGSGESS